MDPQQLDDRHQAVVVLERDEAELDRRHEFAAVRLGIVAEPGAKGGIEPEQLQKEQLPDQVEGRGQLKEAVANQPLLPRRQQDFIDAEGRRLSAA